MAASSTNNSTYSTRELSDLISVSRQAIDQRAKREGWASRPRQGRGGGNEWLVSSMPEETRLAIAKHEAERAAQSEIVTEVCDRMGRRGEAAVVPVAGLPERAQRRGEARAMVLTLFDGWRKTSGLPTGRARVEFCKLYNGGQDREALAVPDWVREHVATVSKNTLINWAKALRNKGVAALAGRYGQHRRGTGVIDSNPELRDLVVGMLYKYPGISAQSMKEAIEARFARPCQPSLRTLSRWLTKYREANDSLLTRCANPDGWRNTHLSATGNASEEVVRLNQRWEYDSTVADVMLADGRRHHIIGILDVWSRRVRFLVSRTSKTAAIKALTRRCILEWGVPEEAKTDNGADYVSYEMQRCFLWLGVTQNLCTPFNPQEKPHIERVFKTFLHGVFELLEGYVGHSVVDRKAIESRKSFADRLRKKEFKDTPVDMRLTAEELQEFCDWWTSTMYEHKTHGSLGVSPFQQAASWRGVVERLEGDNAERALDVLLSPAVGKDGWRTVSKKGLKVDRFLYDHPALRLEDEVPGGRVRVLLDEADAGYVYCFNESNEFVCRAMCPELLGISRQELAEACKAAQAEYLGEATRDLQRTAKRARVDTILQDIVAHASRKAANISALPQPAESYSNHALRESGKAFAATQAPQPQPLTEEQAARREELKRRFQGKVSTLPTETPAAREQRLRKERFAEAEELEAQLEAGQPIPDEKAAWLANYRALPEYRVQKAHQQHVQQFMAQTKKEHPAAQIG
ncbi:DNA-binding protein [Desulfocurvus vexinensis]|uniref:DNA-binding protein n=1 Tax=Desulfocurvus vexinensis TaxID=399548 RepID=UPI001FE0D186|nr:DNA-binding protein [Desulfocurvus vexinensis]